MGCGDKPRPSVPGPRAGAEQISGRRKDEGTARVRGLLTLIGVEVYGLRVKDLAEGMG